MKKIITYIICLSLIILTSCVNKEIDKRDETPTRILLKESTLIGGWRMFIIEVEGKEYLINTNGGIHPLNN